VGSPGLETKRPVVFPRITQAALIANSMKLFPIMDPISFSFPPSGYCHGEVGQPDSDADTEIMTTRESEFF
jgi:hypothetical protein